jgi:hypothetical protein
VYTGKHPRDELFGKLLWKYDPAPYILGLYFQYNTYCYSANKWGFTTAYFAIGPQVTYVAITRESVIELESFNLSGKPERVRNIMYLIRLAPVLSALKKIVPTDGRADFVTYVRCAINSKKRNHNLTPFCLATMETRLSLLEEKSFSKNTYMTTVQAASDVCSAFTDFSEKNRFHMSITSKCILLSTSRTVLAYTQHL